MMGRQSGLGRGLGALIPPPRPAVKQPQIVEEAAMEPLVDQAVAQQSIPATMSSLDRVLHIPVHLIERNPHQPRAHFDHQDLEQLIASIKEHGVLQPLVVTILNDGRYQLIAGERRLRASTIAGLETVPAIVREADEQKKLELAIIENTIRQDLNPVEEAKAYMRLMDEFSLTQEQVAQKMGKSRPHVANIVRLLQLPEEIQNALIERAITASNARTLLSLPTDSDRLELFQQMKQGNFTVRKTEEHVSERVRRVFVKDPNILATEDRLRAHLESPITIKRNVAGEGEIKIKFYSDEELNKVLNTIFGEE